MGTGKTGKTGKRKIMKSFHQSNFKMNLKNQIINSENKNNNHKLDKLIKFKQFQ